MDTLAHSLSLSLSLSHTHTHTERERERERSQEERVVILLCVRERERESRGDGAVRREEGGGAEKVSSLTFVNQREIRGHMVWRDVHGCVCI